MARWAVTFAWRESFSGLCGTKNSSPTKNIAPFVAIILLIQMHRTRGRLPRSHRHQRTSSAAASPDDAARVAGVRHSPRLSAVAAASRKGSKLASSPRASEDGGGDFLSASEVLLSPPTPPPRNVGPSLPSYICDWAQAIQCEYRNLRPLPCQFDGCECTALVHHLCQNAWEQREGYEDTVARYCCRHHPDYKQYRGAPPKDHGVVPIDVLVSDGVWGPTDDDNGSRGENSGDSVELPPFEITDYTADTYDVHERTAHFMERRPISAVNRTAVEAVYMVEALTTVKSMRTIRKPEIAAKLQAKYKELIQTIPPDRFSDSTLKTMMETKYYRAKGTSADGLLTKANEVLKNVRVMAAGIQGIGTPLHQIPSGRSLTDMRNQFILSKWSQTNGTVYTASNDDDHLIAEVPDGWWLLSPNTHLLLAVLVHRSNPDIVADPSNVPTGKTREILRKDSQKDVRERRENDKIVELHTTGRQKAEESMLKSKAQLMAQSIDSGTIEQVKEQLSLLSQFKESFVKVRNGIDGKGEEDFDHNVNDLLGELPFMKKRRRIIDGPGSEISNLGDTPATLNN